MTTTRRNAPRAHNLPAPYKAAPRRAHHFAPHADLTEIRCRAGICCFAAVFGAVLSIAVAFA